MRVQLHTDDHVTGHCSPQAVPSSRVRGTSSHQDSSLQHWLDSELAPYLAEQLGEHPRFKGESVILVRLTARHSTRHRRPHTHSAQPAHGPPADRARSHPALATAAATRAAPPATGPAAVWPYPRCEPLYRHRNHPQRQFRTPHVGTRTGRAGGRMGQRFRQALDRPPELQAKNAPCRNAATTNRCAVCACCRSAAVTRISRRPILPTT